PPNYPLHNQDGSLYWGGGFTNPLASLKQTAESNIKNLVASTQFQYDISEGLQVKSSFGYTNFRLDQDFTYPRSSQDPQRNPVNYSEFGERLFNSFIVEPQLTYGGAGLGGNFLLLVGGTW